jgi:hypothetical protein
MQVLSAESFVSGLVFKKKNALYMDKIHCEALMELPQTISILVTLLAEPIQREFYFFFFGSLSLILVHCRHSEGENFHSRPFSPLVLVHPPPDRSKKNASFQKTNFRKISSKTTRWSETAFGNAVSATVRNSVI